MSKTKIANSYAVMRVLDDGTLKIEAGGLTEARKVKNEVQEAAKKNPGVTFVDAKIGIPVQYKEVVTYELVNTDLSVDVAVSDGIKKEDVKKKVATEEVGVEESKTSNEEVVESVQEGDVADSVVDTQDKDAADIVSEPVSSAVQKPVETDTENESNDDGSTFDELFAAPNPGDKPAEKPELF